jgi:hypothetical protein
MPLKLPERTPNGVEPLEQPSWTRSTGPSSFLQHNPVYSLVGIQGILGVL